MIKRDIKQFDNLTLLKGIFGESLILGSGARGVKINTLPLNQKTGKKTADQVRIERQAAKAKNIIAHMEMQIIPGINTQVPIGLKYSDDVIITGELDIFPTTIKWENKLRIAIVDLKWTKDIDNTYGNFSWGAPEYVDHLQADLYQALVRNANINTLKELFPEFEESVGYDNIYTKAVKDAIERNDIIFVYWIMDFNKRVDSYDPNDITSGVKFIQRLYTDPNNGIIRQIEMRNRIDIAIKILKKQWDIWEARPSAELCNNCPVSELNGGYCKQFINQTTC